jgi:hypothetical protein
MDQRTWSGTLMVFDTWTDDGRRVAQPLINLRHRDLPIPLVMRNPVDGQNMPQPVGTIDTLDLQDGDDMHDYLTGDGPRVASGLGDHPDRVDPPAHPPCVRATGRVSLDLVRDVDPEYAARLEAGQPCGIGVDLDQVVAVYVRREPPPPRDTPTSDAPDALAVVFHDPATAAPPIGYPAEGEQINGWRIMGASLHNTPAWPQCAITLGPPVHDDRPAGSLPA